MEELEKIKASAAEVVTKLRPVSKIDFGYNKQSVDWLEGYIERLRKNGSFESSKSQFIGMFGSYLGECIIHRYGGHWENRNGDLIISFDDQNWILPFNRVRKQWENGLEDRIGLLFEMIPQVWSKCTQTPGPSTQEQE